MAVAMAMAWGVEGVMGWGMIRASRTHKCSWLRRRAGVLSNESSVARYPIVPVRTVGILTSLLLSQGIVVRSGTPTHSTVET